MNNTNDYAPDVNYGNRFPDNWYFMSDKDALLNDKQEEKDRQYCYKPYRNLRNYLT